MLRKLITYLLISFIGISPILLISSAHISEFHAQRKDNNVILEWTTDYESNIIQFDIERSTDTIPWQKIGSKSAYGESENLRKYSFIDNFSIFKTSQSNFYYRLIIVSKDGQRSPHNVIATIAGNSGIKHTWGSIKAMFR